MKVDIILVKKSRNWGNFSRHMIVRKQNISKKIEIKLRGGGVRAI